MTTEDLTQERKQTKSSEMKNVILAEDTKGFLVAHRMTQEVGDYVDQLLEEIWGKNADAYIDEEMSTLWEVIGKAQDEIIRLMGESIKGRLGLCEVAEV
ncbi:MAG: hypothetical protein VB024_07815 [Dysgonamonadaceae bacterium]|nr:hypothetical protein [Dysgonamonadaceae bacterium]